MSAIDRTCPACGAAGGSPCVDLRNGRILGSVHAVRRRGPVGTANRPTIIPAPQRPTDNLESERP